ncbi:endonuclease III [Gluconacetobacter takamatsuzukensis]|uniref:Endonuclease III n=2 Tax=Gluconacetobacter takamatsuzukensis TaxID=1286190 RepID=A0A7W4PQC3_9PROT|nr:endonuclease III [Gluconacetobacter takamatsuzukensis]
MTRTPTTQPARARRRMTLKEVERFITLLAEAHPNAESELDFVDDYTLLVAVALSAQATDVSVNRVTKGLFRDAPNPAAMVALGEDAVGDHIRTIGLWRTKARNVVALSQALLDQHGGQVPHDRAALEALPGVGRKTANVVMNVAFGDSTMAVDTHIFRIGNRTGLAPGKTPRAVEDQLVARIPAPMLRPAHHWLILHGRYVCKARRPECWRCPATEPCQYTGKVLIAP